MWIFVRPSNGVLVNVASSNRSREQAHEQVLALAAGHGGTVSETVSDRIDLRRHRD